MPSGAGTADLALARNLRATVGVYLSFWGEKRQRLSASPFTIHYPDSELKKDRSFVTDPRNNQVCVC